MNTKRGMVSRLQEQMAVAQSGSVDIDILVAKFCGRLHHSRIIDCSLMLWQEAPAKEVSTLGIRVSNVAIGPGATAFHLNGGQWLF